MGEFTYINIYGTKGIEYLWVIAYLLLLAVLAQMLIRAGRTNGGSRDLGEPAEGEESNE